MATTGTNMIDDPNVKIPAAVRAQAARADAIIQQMNAPEADPNVPAAEPVDPGTSAQSLTAEPANPAPAPAQPGAEEDKDDWEHKYKSLHGRYTSLNTSHTRLAEQVQNLQNVISAMQSVEPAQPPAELSFEDITDEERNDYGEDMLKVVGKQAMKQLAPMLKQLQDTIASQAQQIKTLTGKTAAKEQVSVLEFMDAKLPNWKDINTNDDFVAWLALPDAFSGDIRHDMLKRAFAAGDAPRVLAFFNGFLKDEAATSPAKAPEPDPKATRVAKIPLEELAAPGKAKAAAATPAQPDKPIITRAQIAAFYADVSAGKYKGRDAEKDANEAMIFSAQRDGRIR